MNTSSGTSPGPQGDNSFKRNFTSDGKQSNNSSKSAADPVHNESDPPQAWQSGKMRSAMGAHGHSSFSTQNNQQGFFQRHMRRISSSLPRYHQYQHPQHHSRPSHSAHHAEKDKHGHGQWWSASRVYRLPMVGRLKRSWARLGRKTKMLLVTIFTFLLCLYIFYHSPLVYWWRRTSWLGGGEKFVIILAANVEGGVMQWKGAREWAIERDSVRNKRKYAKRWGYDLEIVDMKTQRRYAHEWREGWEKADFIRSTFRKYPKAEWVWWLDLTTMVMEPSYPLQDHIFSSLGDITYRDINEWNPLDITHPPSDEWLDDEAKSPVGDGRPESINMVLSQDCDGFNLGSFFMKRSHWTDQVLDVWWDPVHYEQKHMQWAHKEQDALQELYVAQPWIRQHIGFLPLRHANSFPTSACSPHGKKAGRKMTGMDDEEKDPRFHYHEEDRDFVVNMAGCEWGRDCWSEIYRHRELSYWLNRSWWERFKEDLVAVAWFKLTGQRVKL